MNIENIRLIVQTMARENFAEYPTHYLTEKEVSDIKTVLVPIRGIKGTLTVLAGSYYGERNEIEIKRDREAGVTKAMYVSWVRDEFDNWMGE